MNELDKAMARMGWQLVQTELALQQAQEEIAKLKKQLEAKAKPDEPAKPEPDKA